MRIGTDITKAKALAPKLIIGDSYPAAETKGLTELALRALQRIFPVVMADPGMGSSSTRPGPTKCMEVIQYRGALPRI